MTSGLGTYVPIPMGRRPSVVGHEPDAFRHVDALGPGTQPSVRRAVSGVAGAVGRTDLRDS